MSGFLEANDRPGEHAPSWYAATAGPLPDHPALKGDTRADVCVVGGGYAGLSAALHLAERGRDVVLLEANRVGWGASGRNGGQLAATPRAEMAAHRDALGADDAARVFSIAKEANALVKRLVAEHEIDCALTPGHLALAWRPADARDLADWAEEAEGYGHEVTYHDAAETAALLGTERYHGAALDMAAAHLHPLRLALGLARAASAAGARLHERSRVRQIEGQRVTTDEGTVTADTVLVAANGYLDGLVPAVAQRAMAINNFIATTEPLEPELADRINPRRLSAADTKFVLNYFRLTPDLRLLWGGGESYGRRFPKDIAAVVRRAMADVYPEIARRPVTHAWGGTLAITPHRMPVFQRVGPHLLAISGWSGSGVHMATMGGAIAAEAIAGVTERWDLMARLPTPAFPGGDWFRAPLLVVAMTLAAIRDRL